MLTLLLHLTGGTRHWKKEGATGDNPGSLEVEMTSYVLLALLTPPSMKGFDLDYVSGIVRWLVQQQNSYGGFSSTQVRRTLASDGGCLTVKPLKANPSALQDTVVALQALAKYAAATYSPQGTTTVRVMSSGGLKKEFTVNQDNRLLYQEEQLSEVPGEYTITAEGQSCVLTQVPPHQYLTSTPLHTIPHVVSLSA